MAKRLFSWVLVLALILSMIPVITLGVTAEDALNLHTSHDGWTEWTDSTKLPTAAGKYYLSVDVNLTAVWEAPNGVHLCLNGKTITQKTAGKRVINVNAGRTVSIYDCAVAYNDKDEYVGGEITGGTGNYGSAVWIARNGGVFNLYGGRITGNAHATEAAGGAAFLQSGKLVDGVKQDGAVFNMYGGEIVGNGTSGVSTGGALYVHGEAASTRGGNPAAFNMYGGLISGNKAKNGGAFYAIHDAVINIQGGTVEGNYASNNGGVAYAENDVSVTVKNAKITGNTTAKQGTFWFKQNVTLAVEGSEITGNTAPVASAIYGQNNVQITIKDSTVTENIGSNTSDEGYGAAIYLTGATSKVTLIGDVYIAGNTVANEKIADLYLNSPSGSDMEKLYVQDLVGGYVKFGIHDKAASVAEASDVVFFEGAASTYSDGAVSYMAGTEEKHVGLVDGSFKFIEGHFHEGVKYEAWTDGTKVPSSGNYYLDTDIKVGTKGTVDNGATLYLCMNGHSIDGQGKTGELLRVANGSAYISDCTTVYDDDGYFVSGGKFVNGLRKGNGAGLYVNNAASILEVEGVAFVGNNSTETNEAFGGGAVQVRENTTPAKFVGCLFDSNTSSGGAGALSIRDGGDVILENCAFTNNTAKTGAAVFITGTDTKVSSLVADGCVFTGNTAANASAINVIGISNVTIKDTSITGNTNSSNSGYGAVNLGNGTAVVKIQGDTVITDNLNKDSNQQNLHAQQYETVDFDLSGLGANAKIGVSLMQARIDADFMYFSTTGMTSVPAGVTSDDAAYKVAVDDQGRLELVAAGTEEPPVLEGHTHKLCNDASCTAHGDYVTFEAWEKTDSLPTEGNWYLTANVTVTAMAASTGELNLCLNGKTVTSTGARFLRSTKGNPISLTDCGTTGTLTGSTATYGSAISVLHGSVFNLYGGTITDNNSNSEGTVYVQGGKIDSTTNEPVGGTFNMYGGEISGNTAKFGGAISVGGPTGAVTTNAQVNIYGGKLINNVTTGRGAAINASGKTHIYIENAEISGNTAAGEATIYTTSGGSVTVKNTSIKNNTAKNGAAIAMYGGTLTLDGAVITGNHGTSGGYSAVHAAVSSVAGAPVIVLKGATVIRGNTTGDDKVPMNLYLREQDSVLVNVSGLTNGALIGLTRNSSRTLDRVSTAPLASAGELDRFEADQEGYVVAQDSEGYLVLITEEASTDHMHKLCNDDACTDHKKVGFQKWEKTDSLPTDGKWYLADNVTLTAEHKLTGSLTLCLNGKTITQTAKARVIYVTAGMTLTVTDCGTEGQIVGGMNDTGASVFVLDGSTFNLYAGKITGSKPASENKATSGSAIFLRSTSAAGATFNMYGGEITGNGDEYCWGGAIGNGSGNDKNCTYVNIYGGKIYGNTAATGGAIRLMKKNVTTIYGGEIYGNTAATGGAIYLASGSPELVLEGGKIYDNTADMAGGIYVHADAKVTVSGDPVVYDNTANDKQSNLYLMGESVITLGDVADTVKIGVAADSTGRVISTQTDKDYTANFVSDNAKTPILYKENALWISEKIETSDHYHCVCNGVKNDVCDHAEHMWIMWGDDTAEQTTLPTTSGYYYLTQDIAMSGAAPVESNQNIYICLNGHTVTAAEGNRHFALAKNTVMNITDCAEEAGGFTGGVRTYGGSVNVTAGSTMNLFGGKFFGNTAPDSEGGAIYLQGGNAKNGPGGVFNMYGGEICGNNATWGGAIRSAGLGEGGTVAGVFNMYGGSIHDNTADSYGGAVAANLDTEVNLYGGEIVNNTAGKRGGAFVSYGSRVNIGACTIKGNAAPEGGAAYICRTSRKVDGETVYYASNVTVNDGALITANTAESNCGGLLVADDDVVLTMNGGEISRNVSANGGGVMTWRGATFIMKGGKISNHNLPKGSGGAAYISTGSTFKMEGGTITNNTAKNAGAVYFLRSTGVLSGGTISNNRAQHTSTWKNGKETKSGGTGGAMYFSGAKVDLKGTSLIGNYASVNGGAIIMGRATYTENGVKKYDLIRVNVTGGYFSGNSTAGAGGVMLIQSEGSVVNMYGGTFTNNQAKNAGAIYVSTKTQFNMSGGSVYNNHATNTGGAFYFLKCTGNITGGQIYDNTAETNGGHMVISGADPDCFVTVKNVKFHDGFSKTAGAIVIQSKNARGVFENCDFYDNNADGGTGGAVYVSNNALADFTNCKFYNNTSGNSSGAMHAAINSKINIDGCDFTENSTKTMGGAMYTNPRCVIDIRNTTFSKNVAGTTGGALVCRGTMYLTNVTIENCSAENGGAVATDTNNTNGAGVMEGLVVTDSQIRNNTASLQGGAFYIWKGRALKLYNSKISGNTAGAEGGAIWAYEDTWLFDTTITGNSSGGEGYAVYMNDANYDGHSYWTSKNRIGGDVVIKDNNGGDLWMGPDVVFAIDADGLGENTHIELTMDSGVVTQRILGAFHYEGGEQVYTVTYGTRSMTDPETDPTLVAEDEDTKNDTNADNKASGDTWLYVGIGIFAALIIVVGAVLVTKKKKAGKAADKAGKE